MKKILDCTTLLELIELTYHRLRTYGTASEEELLHIFSLCDAYWYHDGDPKKPHAELTGGWCSNGFLTVCAY
ncbi:MAG: hypothetical protein COX29_04250 [Candidatus Moranbacteria bacterium CG23_combo_of_CG06-09_8_20_14_all_35_22]|nr:MAG: hypothetical protein COX29_04250 [Candidatus Moranbacteria bacterium CG23_combo_of_CG06-09_8_20_14_all_35_22]